MLSARNELDCSYTSAAILATAALLNSVLYLFLIYSGPFKEASTSNKWSGIKRKGQSTSLLRPVGNP